MAGDVNYSSTDPDKSGMDYQEHAKTYDLFLSLTKWVVLLVVLILVFMAVFLTGPSKHPQPPTGAAPPAAGATR